MVIPVIQKDQLKPFMLTANDGDYFNYNNITYIVIGKLSWLHKNNKPFDCNFFLNSITALETTSIVIKSTNKVAVFGLLQIGNRFVCVKRKDSETYGLIGGKKDDNETLTDALIRETKEETGYDVNVNHTHYPYVFNTSEYLLICYLISLKNNAESTYVSVKEDESPFLYLLTKEQLLNNTLYREYNEKVFNWFSF